MTSVFPTQLLQKPAKNSRAYLQYSQEMSEIYNWIISGNSELFNKFPPQYLIQVRLTNYERNILHVAVSSHQFSFIDRMCSNPAFKALLDHQDINGEAPLHLAVFCKNVPGFKRLCQAGANLRLPNKQGEHPLDVAIDPAMWKEVCRELENPINEGNIHVKMNQESKESLFDILQSSQIDTQNKLTHDTSNLLTYPHQKENTNVQANNDNTIKNTNIQYTNDESQVFQHPHVGKLDLKYEPKNEWENVLEESDRKEYKEGSFRAAIQNSDLRPRKMMYDSTGYNQEYNIKDSQVDFSFDNFQNKSHNNNNNSFSSANVVIPQKKHLYRDGKIMESHYDPKNGYGTKKYFQNENAMLSASQGKNQSMTYQQLSVPKKPNHESSFMTQGSEAPLNRDDE